MDDPGSSNHERLDGKQEGRVFIFLLNTFDRESQTPDRGGKKEKRTEYRILTEYLEDFRIVVSRMRG